LVVLPLVLGHPEVAPASVHHDVTRGRGLASGRDDPRGRLPPNLPVLADPPQRSIVPVSRHPHMASNASRSSMDSAILSLATSTALGSLSMPMKCRPNPTAATPVVPDPTKGSRTVSPGSVS